jgi:hypothetical protein
VSGLRVAFRLTAVQLRVHFCHLSVLFLSRQIRGAQIPHLD